MVVACPRCGCLPEADRWAKPIPYRQFDWHVSCSGCYDGAPDSGLNLEGWGATFLGAVKSWNGVVYDEIWWGRSLETDMALIAELVSKGNP